MSVDLITKAVKSASSEIGPVKSPPKTMEEEPADYGLGPLRPSDGFAEPAVSRPLPANANDWK